MPKYTVPVKYDMGMSHGSEVYEFKVDNDDLAREHIRLLEGTDLAPNKRNLHFEREKLARLISFD